LPQICGKQKHKIMKEQITTIQLPARSNSSVFSDMRGAHIALRVKDYAGIMKWYQEKLDFRVIHEWPYGDLQLAYLAPANDDNFWIEILGGGEPSSQSDFSNLAESLHPSGYHHFCIDVKSVDETIAELRRRGVTILEEPFDLPVIGKRLAFFSDPYDNPIELAEKLK
jgi:catechol 2,3-dioxygenase-like lactoylglutathione lyase family enzyme